MRHLRDRAERLCRELAPEYSPYVLTRDDLPADCRGDAHVLAGLSMPGLGIAASERLKRLARWRGNQPAILVDLESIGTRDREASKATRRRAFEREFWGTVLHELAHLVDEGCRIVEDTPEMQRASLQAARSIFTRAVPRNLQPELEVPWFFHPHGFLRALLHLVYRANQGGAFHCYAADAFDGELYGLSSAWRYSAAIGDEPERLKDRPMSAVLASPPPEAFAELWRADVLRWMETTDQAAERIGARLAALGRRAFIRTDEREENE